MSGPARGGHGTEIGADGRYVHTFRQSWLKTADTCLQRARLEWAGEFERWETDAASMGTAIHAAIEASLTDLRDYGCPLTIEDAIEVAQATFSELMALPNFRWVQVTEPTARKDIAAAVRAWHERVLPDLEPLHMELNFGPLVLHEDDQRVIQLTGSIDYVDMALGLVDWKTANRRYERWEYQRWAIQPTVYTWAASQLGIYGGEMPADGHPFTYFVFLKGGDRGDVQQLTVTRTPADWGWLKRKCFSLAILHEAGLPEWPRNDNHALCSERWCPAWSICKGAAVCPPTSGEHLPSTPTETEGAA